MPSKRHFLHAPARAGGSTSFSQNHNVNISTSQAMPSSALHDATGTSTRVPHRPKKLSRYRTWEDPCQDTLALVLAGGRGSRLQPLTGHHCKPAVSFGGVYRLIDFAVSNCVNSGIRRIGVLTQYRHQSLIRHLQDTWPALRRDQNEFIDAIPAQQRPESSWYQGTADAVTQNIDMIQDIAPRHTLIVAGDHIYKADYRRMIENHILSGASATICCCDIARPQASRFGVLGIDSDNVVTNFEEKPIVPRSLPNRDDVSLISMGIYIFDTAVLLNYLLSDSANPESSHDFGRDIIPALIQREKVNAYLFHERQEENYWRDVGTVDAYYEASMQLLGPSPSLRIHDPEWPIQAAGLTNCPAQLLCDSRGNKAEASNCILSPGCLLRGSRVHQSIISSDVQVNERCVIEGSILLPGAFIGRRCRIRNAIIDAGTFIADDTTIGFDHREDGRRHFLSELGITVVTGSPVSTSVQVPDRFLPVTGSHLEARASGVSTIN